MNHSQKRAGRQAGGFALIEVLVALTIVAVALMAGMKASGALTLHAQRQTDVLLGQMCAENALHQMRLSRQMPGVGQSSRECQQGTQTYTLALDVQPTPNGFALEGLNKPVPTQPWLSEDTRVLEVLPRNPATDAASLATLALGPEPVLAPQPVLPGSTQTPANRVRVATDGVRPFAIVPPDAAALANAGGAQ